MLSKSQRVGALTLIGSMILAGCAAMQRQEAMDVEQLLAAAGFRMKLADSPEKLAHLQTLTQLKLVPHPQEDGGIRFVYADAKYCQCVYAGDEAAYERYQRLALKKQIAEEQRMAAEMNSDAAMNWGMWGPWGW